METKWDEEAGRAVSKTEQNLQEIMAAFDEMDYVEKPKSTKPKSTGQTTMTQHTPPVEQVDTNTQDDISSFGNSLLGGQRPTTIARASAFVTTYNPPEDSSVAQHSMAASVTSLESRMTALESKLDILDRMSAFLDRFDKGDNPTNGSAATNSTPSYSKSVSVVGASTETKSSEAPAS